MVWLIRHAETDLNRLDVKHGRLDVPLNARGMRRAEQIALPPATVVYTSPLTRAMQTARIFARRLGLQAPIVVAAFTERSFGAAEGLTPASIAELFPDGVPGMETYADAARRARPVLAVLAPSALVVTHAGVIKGIAGRGHVENGEVVEVCP